MTREGHASSIICPLDVREIDSRGWYKPLDVGEAGIAASVNDSSRLLVVATGHPVHGQVQLTAAPELPLRSRYDQASVRRYRKRLSARGAASFGLRSAGSRAERRARPAWLWHDAIPLTSYGPDGGAPSEPGVATLIPHPDEVGGARCVVQVRLPGPDGPDSSVWTGRLRLARAPYPQLTEGGPLPGITYASRLARSAEALVIHDTSLGMAAAIGGDLALGRSDGHVALVRGWTTAELPVRDDWRAIVIALAPEPALACEALDIVAQIEPERLLLESDRRWSRRWLSWPADGPLALLARRGLAYALGCCVVPVAGGTCLVTDHRLLPLAWTRDGYFVARSFLDWAVACRLTEPFELVRSHLEWLFVVAERPQGWWARSHLIGGQRKDGAFQADQQLYPLLELADYCEMAADVAPLAAYADQIPDILAALDARTHSRTGLIGTDETPADEPARGTFLVSTQILAWRVFSRLAALGVGGSAMAIRAQQVQEATLRHLRLDLDGRPALAYALGADGRLKAEYDANDLPLAMAVEWGFCAADDPIWTETMRRVLDAAHAGYFAGPLGGLGSVHTPGPWPLGQLQAVIAGSGPTDRRMSDRSDVALQALQAEAQWDGLLPEASDSASGRPISRPWFAWPGAVAASQHLGRHLRG